MVSLVTQLFSICYSDVVAEPNPENLKQNGNELYKQKKYREALAMYSEAIRLVPSCAAYYGNRSATYMMLNKYKDALDDAQQATSIDKEFTKVS